MSDPIPDQHGRTFLVTGANSGLGFETCRWLIAHRATVIMTARDQAKGEAARQRICEEQPDAERRLQLHLLDLSDLASVRDTASAVQRSGLRLDVLINNAGVMMTPRQLTKDGYELQFATNHLGHFALTLLLLETMRDSKDPRVVTVASEMHRLGRGRFADAAAGRDYRRVQAYAESKLANVMFALELDRRLRADGAPVRSVLAHPGYAATNLQTTGPRGVVRQVLSLGNRVVAQSAASGARSQLHAATAQEVRGGQYFGPALFARGRPRSQRPSALARDREHAQHLWQLSESLTGARFHRW